MSLKPLRPCSEDAAANVVLCGGLEYFVDVMREPGVLYSPDNPAYDNGNGTASSDGYAVPAPAVLAGDGPPALTATTTTATTAAAAAMNAAWQPLESPPSPIRTSVVQGQTAEEQGQAAGAQGQAQDQATVALGGQAQGQAQSQALVVQAQGGLDWSVGESRVSESELRPPALLESPIPRAMSLAGAYTRSRESTT